jgi:hypothetical protein
VTDPAARERAALDVLDKAPGRLAGRPRQLRPRHPALARDRSRPASRPSKAPETITGLGLDELSAMIDLALRPDERRRAERVAEIDRRGRLAYLEGAEEQSGDAAGRQLTRDELERGTKRYPEE